MFKRAFATVVYACVFLSVSSCSTESIVAGAAVSGTDVSHDKKLQAETDALLPLFDSMPPVPIYLKDAPILKSGTNVETGMAYTHCYNREFPFILVKKSYYQKVNRKQLINALKHELTHAWLCRQHIMSGHDERFRQKFKQVGGFGN